MSRTIEVDTKTLVRFWLVLLGFVLAGLFIYRALTGLIIVGIAVFLAVAIQPLAQKINRLTKKDQSSLSSVLAYVLIIGVVVVIISVVGPVVVGETAQFVGQLPGTFEHSLGGWDGINDFGDSIGIHDLQGEISGALEAFSDNFLRDLGNTVMTGVGAVSQITAAVVLTLVLTLLFAIEGSGIMRSFWSIMERRYTTKNTQQYQRLVQRMANVISTYVSRQVLVAVLDGCVVTGMILLLTMVFDLSRGLALPMGLIALVLYLIPMFGQVIGCGLISLILLFSSPVAAIIFFVCYIIYAQIENNFIAPKIQGDALNLPAAMILVAITIGIYTLGLLGAIIAIPIAGCIRVVFEELPNLREGK